MAYPVVRYPPGDTTNQVDRLFPILAGRLCMQTRVSRIPQFLLRPRQYICRRNLNKFHLSTHRDMPENAQDKASGDCSIPNIPDGALPEEEYFRAVRKNLEEIIGRFRLGRASKIEVQTTIVAYIGKITADGSHDLDSQEELKPWFEELESDARRLERAKQRGKASTRGRGK
ncbi:hypothetical protein BDZ89DRAFT_1043104, partial [Hymenopellis radicata]